MKNRWLSDTWEANWRPFQYFNFYRLVTGALLIFASFISPNWLNVLIFLHPMYFGVLGGMYMALVLGGLLASLHWQKRFNMQVSLQVAVDVAVVSLLMHGLGGVSSGLGVLLLISLAAASLVGQGRLVLFYAALATLGVLITQSYGILSLGYEPTSIVSAGVLSGGFFATAILARLLGQRAMVNEDLARRRGVALDNQMRISQRVIERMQDGVLVVSAQGHIRQHNPMAESLLGVGPGEGFRLADHNRQLAGMYVHWWQTGEGGALDFVGVRGRELRARFERTSSSEEESLIFLEDVGRVRERAQQMKLAALGRLTASIAHEIRNPLASISHAGDLLREEKRGDMQERLLRILRDNVNRIDRIVQDVLELGRRDRMWPELIDLAAWLPVFLDEFCHAAGAAPALVSLECPLETRLCFDRAHLHQVLANLLSNAVRHCRGQAGSVRLWAATLEEGRVELHIVDDGDGISPDLALQIFEPFFTTHRKGTGLGLFIARELCEANGAMLALGDDAATGGHFVLQGRSDTCQQVETNGPPGEN